MYPKVVFFNTFPYKKNAYADINKYQIIMNKYQIFKLLILF